MARSNGAPDRIRTCDRRIRSAVLYPAELRAREATAYLDQREVPTLCSVSMHRRGRNDRVTRALALSRSQVLAGSLRWCGGLTQPDSARNHAGHRASGSYAPRAIQGMPLHRTQRVLNGCTVVRTNRESELARDAGSKSQR
jgi:hypothetical protein